MKVQWIFRRIVLFTVVLLAAGLPPATMAEISVPNAGVAGGLLANAVPGLPGDCDGDGAVSIGEVQRDINMFLGVSPPECNADGDENGSVSIGEVQKGVNAFLGLLHVIQATAGEGGAISPSGAVLVDSGAPQTFTFYPEAGFELSDALVDGLSNGATPVFTFQDVQDNHTISALFTPTCQRPAIESWTAHPMTVLVGGTSALAGSIGGPDPTWSIEIVGGTGDGTADPPSGAGPEAAANFTGTTVGDVTLRLTASNGCGSVSETLTVTVVPPPPVIEEWSASAGVLAPGESSDLTGVITGTDVTWIIEQVVGLGAGVIDPATGTGTAADAAFTAVGGGPAILRLTVQNAGGTASADLTLLVDTPAEELLFTPSADFPGPFAADGNDGTAVSVLITDVHADPIPGLEPLAVLFSGDDEKVPQMIEDLGDGTYRVGPVTATTAGENRLVLRVGTSSERMRLPLTFNPGPPDHVWIANLVYPVTDEESGGMASFDLMLKDAEDNVLDPALGQWQIFSDDPNADIQTAVDAERSLIHVEVTLSTATGAENNWAEPVLHVLESVTGAHDDFPIPFPYLNWLPIPGPDDNTVGLRLFLFDPGSTRAPESLPNPKNGLNIGVEFPFPVEITSWGDPDPTDDCQTEIIPLTLGFQVQGQCEIPHFGMFPVLDVFFDATSIPPAVYELNINGGLLFATTEVVLANVKVKVPIKLPKTLCLKVWLAPGVAKATAEAHVKVLKKTYGDAVKLCCPNFSFTVTYNDISADDWKAIDKDGDGKLDEFTAMDPKTKKPAQTSEEKELLKKGDANCLNAFYVPDMSDGSLGEAFGEIPDSNGTRDSNSVVVNGGSASDTTLAHELGHCLGECQDNKMPDGTKPPASNLMWQTKHDKKRGGLTKEQCEQIKKLNP